jgi:hypothetical protein
VTASNGGKFLAGERRIRAHPGALGRVATPCAYHRTFYPQNFSRAWCDDVAD